MKIQHGAEVAEAYPRRYSKFNNEINAKDTVPSKDEVKKVLNAKNVFEANKNDEAWCNSHFNSCPWGFGYKASPRSNSGSATEAMKLFLLAKLIKWQDLETQLTRTVKETYKIKAEVAKPVLEYWKTNINQILSVINAAAAEVKTKTEGLQEDIEKHDTLNPKLWNEDNTLKEEVKDKINQIVDEFLDGLKEDEISIDVKDVIITGSNCSYNYTKDSDIDLHIVAGHIDAPENLYDKIYSAYRSLFNKKLDIEFYGIPVEIYVETEETPRVSNGVYSVMNNAWIKEPVAEDIPDIDKDAFDKEFKVWEDRYNEIISNIDAKLSEDLVTDTWSVGGIGATIGSLLGGPVGGIIGAAGAATAKLTWELIRKIIAMKKEHKNIKDSEEIKGLLADIKADLTSNDADVVETALEDRFKVDLPSDETPANIIDNNSIIGLKKRFVL